MYAARCAQEHIAKRARAMLESLHSMRRSLAHAFRSSRRLMLAAIVSALCVSSSHEQASAATSTDSLPVSATINATCTISVSIDLDFGTVDLSSPIPQSGLGTISVNC